MTNGGHLFVTIVATVQRRSMCWPVTCDEYVINNYKLEHTIMYVSV